MADQLYHTTERNVRIEREFLKTESTFKLVPILPMRTIFSSVSPFFLGGILSEIIISYCLLIVLYSVVV